MWEWRAFAARFDAGDLPDPADALDARVDVYLLAPGLGLERGLKLRGAATLELKLRRDAHGGLERWEKVFVEDLEVPPWRTRELSRLLAPGAPVPVRPLRAKDDVLRLVRDLRLGAPREALVSKAVATRALAHGVRIERARLRAAGRELETVAVQGDDPAAVQEVVARLPLPPDARVASYPAWLGGA